MVEYAKLIDHMREYARQSAVLGEPVQTSLPDLGVFSCDRETTFEATLYQPVYCLILQGKKETIIGDRTITYGAGDALVVSHDLPVVSRITEASAKHPYLALIFYLDLTILRGLQDQLGVHDQEEDAVSSIAVSQAEARLVGVLERYFSLHKDPMEEKVLGPLVRKEIHFRLLTAPHGGMLRKMLNRDSHASRIDRAIGIIRQKYKSSFVVQELAQSVGMSTSSFHEHFKSVTQTTPLRYQKDLRLMEAKRLLLEGEHSVSTVAYEVGYESPNQFSREYSRKFGVAPQRDARNHAIDA
ncbi:MAG: AraC family transcriptional regulator [Pseudomonadota bacterium]